ncbi:MAG: hypothetical protein QG608_3661 [Actinomycetota bacterium]|nr:hypothetical protein [Actinomycetota bacterium]
MLVPWAVEKLDGRILERWRTHYVPACTGRDRLVEEGIWRRTQDPCNAAFSGGREPRDARRRLIHYRFTFGVLSEVLVVARIYLYFHVALPEGEIRVQSEAVRQALRAGGWRARGPVGVSQVFCRGDLRCTVRRHVKHPEDTRAQRVLPVGYSCLDVQVDSDPVPFSGRRLPWEVLASGFRVPDPRGSPETVPDLSCLVALAPFQVETGCGLSVESGVPPLHRLHDIYQVTDPLTRRFVLDPVHDRVVARFLADPEGRLPEHCEMYRACLHAEPNAAHRALRDLYRAGLLIGPVITNNFDGILDRYGVPERCVRRYDEIVPELAFAPRARALLVLGSHADRRGVQRRARRSGLRVVFCDPEGFDGPRGSFVPYPLEGPQDGDLLCRRRAGEALPALARSLRGEKLPCP